MNKYIQPNRASCFLTAVCMCIKVDVHYAMAELGHDGTEKLFPQFDVPKCYRGYHECEMSYLCHLHGYTFTRFDREIYMGFNESTATKIKTPYCFDLLIKTNKGVLTCERTLNNDHGHVVAWDGFRIYDPNGMTSDFFGNWNTFYKITKELR